MTTSPLPTKKIPSLNIMKQGIGNKQSGAALILMAFMLGLAVTAYLLKSMNATSLAQQQDEKTYKALADAKAMLIAWSVSSTYNPGEMPWPDRYSDVGGYDGSSDCVNGSLDHKNLLGQLPSMPATSPCLDPNIKSGFYKDLSTYPGLGQVFLDGQGNRLWYAVSRNLVRDYESPSQSPIINPGIANAPYTDPPYLLQKDPTPPNAPPGYVAPKGATAYPWLIVKDRNGVVVSDRVAVVLIAPGAPIGNQNRSAAAPTVGNFLDTFQFKADAASRGNATYAVANQDFYMAEDSKSVPASDTTYKQPYYFNDKLVYITIDELLDALQKRVGEVAKASLNKYFSANGYYPNAAYLNAGAGKRYCVGNKLDGALPVDIAPASYSCEYLRTSTDSKVTCSFDNIISVAFTRATGSFTSNSAVGSCKVSSSVTTSSDGLVCTCTGAGSCSNGAAKFECSANGECAATEMADDGAYDGTYTISGGVFSSVNWPCQFNCATDDVSAISCGSGNSVRKNFSYDCADAALDNGTFPAWFKANLWQDYIYYRIADSNGLSAGKVPAAAIVVTVGPAIIAAPFASSKGSAQVRPSCNINDYLDSVENTNVDTTFEASNKIKSKNYNDQIFLLKP